MPNKNSKDPAIGGPGSYGRYSSQNAAFHTAGHPRAAQKSPAYTDPADTQPGADAIALARAARIALEKTPPAGNTTETAAPDQEYQNHPGTAPIAGPRLSPDSNQTAADAPPSGENAPPPNDAQALPPDTGAPIPSLTPGYDSPAHSLNPLEGEVTPGPLSDL